MTRRDNMTRAGTAIALAVLLLCGSARGLGQAPPDARAAAAAALARANFDVTAGTLTLYDRQGKVVRTIGERAVALWPAFSPDGTRLAASRRDATTDNTEIWVFDLSTGAGARITSGSARVETSPVWSPDGSQIAYVSDPGGSPGLYRKASDGTGSAELLYEHPDWLNLTDWSRDGRFLTFYDATSLYLLPIAGVAGEGKAIEVLPGFSARGGRFSPDGRFLAYLSTQSGRPEIWVRPFDPSAPDAVPATGPWQISDRGGAGMIFWRQDGRELYYLAADQGATAVDVRTDSAFTSSKPRRLFEAPEHISGTISGTSASRDGRQFLFNVVPKPRGAPFPWQLAVFDRQGNVVRALGEPRVGYVEPALSPDGTRVAATTYGQSQIEVFDVATGDRTLVTSSTPSTVYQGAPVWSPDGRQLVSFSRREQWSGLYRQPSDGSGLEELLYRQTFEICLPLTDWSADGRVLSFGGGGVLWTVPVNGEREASELVREEFVALGARFSPDSQYVAYLSNQSGRYEVYVQPFDPSTGAAGREKWQVSTDGGLGLIQWRGDGRELYYLARDGAVMALAVSTSPTFQAGRPSMLFRARARVGALLNGAMHHDTTACGELGSGCGQREPGSVSRNGQRFVFAVPQPPRESTVARAILQRYIGTWRQPGGGERLVGNTVVVTLEGDSLMIQTDEHTEALFAASEATFFLMSGTEFEFVSDEQGDPQYLFVYQGGTPVQLLREP